MHNRTTAPRRGFTLVEIAIVIAIIGVLATVIGPELGHAQQSAQKLACEEDRRTVEEMDLLYSTERHAQAASLEALVEAGYLGAVPRCKRGGTWAWTPGSFSRERTLVCSVHGVLEGRRLAPAVDDADDASPPLDEEFDEELEESADEDDDEVDVDPDALGYPDADVIHPTLTSRRRPTPADKKVAANVLKAARDANRYFRKQGKSLDGFAESYKPSAIDLRVALDGPPGELDRDTVVLRYLSDDIAVFEGYSDSGYVFRTVLDRSGNAPNNRKLLGYQFNLLDGSVQRFRKKF